MKTTLRFSTAAWLLMASLGALAVSTSAVAQHSYGYVQPGVVAPPAVAHPAIERFVLRHAGSLEPGRELRFRLVGAPGGQAWLTIPGVLRAAPMAETRPGVYEAVYAIRWRDDPDAFPRAVATLQSGGQRISARVYVRGDRGWGRSPAHDDRDPQITQLTPDHGERLSDRGWTRISARLQDDGSGIDPHSVMLRVDGRDVTDRARIDEDSVRYAEDLAPGRHAAELVVRDRAGNASRRSWSFIVMDRDRSYGYYGAPYQRW